MDKDPTNKSKGVDPASFTGEVPTGYSGQQVGRIATDAYRRELEARLNNDPQFQEELALPFGDSSS